MAASSSTASLQRKVEQILSSRVRVDRPEMAEGLEGLARIFEDNTFDNRRKLRSVLEQQRAEIYQEVVESFSTVKAVVFLFSCYFLQRRFSSVFLFHS